MNTDLLGLLLRPISESSPTGDDPKYLAEYELVKNEVAKTSARDFELVADNCLAILGKQAKDMTILGFGMLANAALERWDVCATYSNAYVSLAKDHWESLHPQRERARINALKWLNEERVVGMFVQAAATEEDFASLSELVESMQALRQLIISKLPDDTPSIKALVQAIEQKCKEHKPKVQAPPAAPTPLSPPKAVAPVVEQGVPATSSAAPEMSSSSTNSTAAPVVSEGASRSDMQKTIQQVALQFSSIEPDKALGYILIRVNKWQDQVQPPKADSQGKTPFNPPLKQRRDYFSNLHSQQAYDAILEKCEAIFTEPGMHFWFDLQYYVVQALRAKGRSMIADAIENELRAMIARVPQLTQLLYNDGTPFASPITAEWLSGLLATNSGPATAPAAQSKASRNVDLAEDLEKANDLGSAGKWGEALALLHNGIMHGSLKDRTERECALGRIAMNGGKSRIAFHYAQILVKRIEERQLDEWDPLLACEIWKLAFQSSKALGSSEPKAADITTILAMQAQAFAKLSLLEPSFAAQTL